MSTINYYAPTKVSNIAHHLDDLSREQLSGRIMHQYTTRQLIMMIILSILFIAIACGIYYPIQKYLEPLQRLSNFGNSDWEHAQPMTNTITAMLLAFYLPLILASHGYSFKSIIKLMCMKFAIFLISMVVIEIISSIIVSNIKCKINKVSTSDLYLIVGSIDLVLLLFLFGFLIVLGVRDSPKIGLMCGKLVILDSDRIEEMKKEKLQEDGPQEHYDIFKIYGQGANQFKVIDGPEGPSVVWSFYGPKHNEVTVIFKPGASIHETVTDINGEIGYTSTKTDGQNIVD